MRGEREGHTLQTTALVHEAFIALADAQVAWAGRAHFFAIAARHVWLQSLPKDRIPECGPGLEYMLKKLPFTQALEKILTGSGECAEVGWTFLGLSIAGWSLVWFVLFGGFALYLTLAGMRRIRRA